MRIIEEEVEYEIFFILLRKNKYKSRLIFLLKHRELIFIFLTHSFIKLTTANFNPLYLFVISINSR